MLPHVVYSRAEIARVAELRACFAVPLVRSGAAVAVVVFYSASRIAHDDALEETILLLANEILSDTCTRMSYAPIQFIRQGSPAPGRKSQAGVSKVWEAAKAALSTSPAGRTPQEVGDVIKYSKRLPFFKYVTTATREALCAHMELIEVCSRRRRRRRRRQV